MNYYLITVDGKPAYIALSELEAQQYRQSLEAGFNAQLRIKSSWKQARDVKILTVPGDDAINIGEIMDEKKVIEYVESGKN
jgi:hypothetical protein